MAVFFIRVIVLVLIAAAIAVASVPILVLVDLVGGGSGYGLCPGGIEICDRPYSTAAELAILLTVALGAIVVSIRLLMRLARRLRDDNYQLSQ